MTKRRQRIPGLGLLIGLDVVEENILDRLGRIERLIAAQAADQATLEAVEDSLRATDATLDAIEPTPAP
jgi:hypothetical protein